MVRKLGRIKPHVVPRLKFVDYVEAGAPEVPASCYRPDSHFPWTILANGPDSTVTNPIIQKFGVGCCVISARLHAIQHAKRSANLPVPAFTGDHALAIYGTVTSYDPSKTEEDGENPTDQGTDPSVMDKFWQETGISLPEGGVDKLAAHLEVSPKDWTHRARAIWEFDGVGSGYNLTQSAMEAPIWKVIPNDPEIGGHEIFEFSYDSSGDGVDSWGELVRVTRGYIEKQCDQCTVYLSQDQIKKTGISDTGFNYDKLHTDFERLF